MIQFAYPLVLLVLPVLAAVHLYLLRKRGVQLLRLLTLTALLVAISAPRITRQLEQDVVLFLVDRSASVDLTESTDEIAALIRERAADLHDCELGVIGFASAAESLAPISVDPPSVRFTNPAGADSRLGPAVSLALTTLPADAANQIILVSDGRFTDSIDSAIGSAQQRGVPISVLPVGASLENDLALADFDAPGDVSVGRRFEMHVNIAATAPQQAVLAIYRNDDLVWQSDVEVTRRGLSVAIRDTLVEAGFHRYDAVVRGSQDPVPENDQLSVLVQSSERPPVLLVDGGTQTAIPSLLSSLGIGFTQIAEIPSLDTLGLYRQMILTGLPFAELTTASVDTVGHFVQSLGGGLLVIEGQAETHDFAGGGLESLLPISYTIPEKGQEASLAIVFALDRSSSMQARSEGMLKIDILKESAASSIALLAPETLVGILAFNRDQAWPVPLAPIGDAETAYEALRPLNALGGTDIYYAVQAALDQIETVEARSKHILLVSDGMTTNERRDFNGLFARLESLEDVTMSAIAVGTTPNTPLLSALVEAGRGTLYEARRFSELPQITIQATQRISRQRYVTGDIEVTGSLLAADGIGALPPLEGYVASYARGTTRVGLWGGDDPVFASWRTGLGVVGVLNTDLSGHWSTAWLDFSGLSALFAEMLATTEPLVDSSGALVPMLSLDADRYHLWVDARTPEHGYADFLSLEAAILPEETSFDLEQVGPGMYHAAFQRPAEGGHSLRIRDPSTDRIASIPFTVPYPEEYAAFGPDMTTLEEIAERTGGRLLGPDTSLPEVSGHESATSRSLVGLLLLVTLLLFVLDLVLRKLPRRRSV